MLVDWHWHHKPPPLVTKQPLDAKLLVIDVRHFHQDRLHQHLGTTNIQLGYHRGNGLHHIRVGGNDQRIGGLVSLDDGAGLAGGLLGVLRFYLGQVVSDPSQHLGDVNSVGVFEVNHVGIADALQGNVQVTYHGADSRPLNLIAGDQDAVGALVGHHAGSYRNLPRQRYPCFAAQDG